MSTQTEITRISIAKGALQMAIAGQGVAVPDSALLSDYAGFVNQIQRTPPPQFKDVNFWTPDGALIAGWDAADRAAATSLPPAPELPGLVFQGYNHTLAEIKQYPLLDVGVVYGTESGRTEFIMDLRTAAMPYTLTFIINNIDGGEMNVDWGDGSAVDTDSTAGTITFTHEFTQQGTYTVSVDSTAEYALTGTSASPYNMFRAAAFYDCTSIRTGDRCIKVGFHAFRDIRGLQSIFMSNAIHTLDTYLLSNTTAVRGLVIPAGASFVANAYFTFAVHLSPFISLPPTFADLGAYCISDVRNLKRFIVPPSVSALKVNTFTASGQHTSLREIIVYADTPPTLPANSILLANPATVVRVPSGSVDAYKVAENWSAFADRIIPI